MKETYSETSANAPKAKPGKFWLWGLAIIQLVVVILLTAFEVEETVTKFAGFVILLLCGSMDIKAVKKAGYPVSRWWWGLAVFLPPVYMIVRVCKTDKAPGARVKRFAPVIVWVLLLGLLMGLTGWMAADYAELQELDRKSMERRLLLEFASDYVFDSDLTVDEVLDITMVSTDNPREFPRKGQATVKRSTTKGRPASAILRYDFSQSANGDIEYSITPADEGKLLELKKMAAE